MDLHPKKRLFFPDAIRLVAIILMVFYHFSYDLVYFKILNFDIINHPFWWSLPRIIVFLFLFTVGFSLALTHKTQFLAKKFFRRFFQIFLSAISISAITYLLFPERWVYFGTLHCIALSSLITVGLIAHPRFLGAMGIFLFAIELSGHGIPWIHLEHSSMDYVELFPWIGASFLGVFVADLYQKSKALQKIEELQFFKTPTFRFGQKISEHSLLVYLVHQPLLFGLIFVINWLFQ